MIETRQAHTQGTPADTLSILTHKTRRLAKLWRADGAIESYDRAKNFGIEQRTVENLSQLAALLLELERRPNACLIRGRQKTPSPRALRRLDEFDDQPLHTLLIEVDDFEPLMADPVEQPALAAREYIKTTLPVEFHGVQFYWQLSNSAGAPGKEHLLKMHLWFWLETPATSAALKHWASINTIACDKAVFNPVQIHYTSAPVFADGVRDPIRWRSGLLEVGFSSESVALTLAEPTSLTPRKQRMRGAIAASRADETIAFLDVTAEGSYGELHITCPFADGHSVDSDPSATVYFPAGTGGFEQGHFKCLHASCADRKDEDFLDAVGARVADLSEFVRTAGELQQSTPGNDNTAPGELPAFERNKSGAILATASNIDKALRRGDICGFQLCFDEFRDEVLIAPHGQEGAWRALVDTDYFTLRLQLENGGFKPIARDLMRDAVDYVAGQRMFDSAIEWLSNLQWDGVSRVDTFLSEYFGANDTPYVRSVSRYMWSAMAGRVMDPGVKADMSPVLISPQGHGKSFGIENLVPSHEFFTSIDLMARDADQARRMRGKLVIEIGELRGLHSRDMESIKDFMTRRHESWIPKYKEFARSYPRRSIFIGTGNQTEFLADTTGNRRWLPVPCGRVDHARVRNDRLQLWAEARERFGILGVEWREAQELSTATHDEYRMSDTWAERIHDWLHTSDDLDGRTPANSQFLKLGDIFLSALGMDLKQIKRGDELRVGGILREMGYTRTTVREGGKTHRAWTLAHKESP